LGNALISSSTAASISLVSSFSYLSLQFIPLASLAFIILYAGLVDLPFFQIFFQSRISTPPTCSPESSSPLSQPLPSSLPTAKSPSSYVPSSHSFPPFPANTNPQTGDAGGNTTALGIQGAVVPGAGPNSKTEVDTTVFNSLNAASDGLGRTEGQGKNTLAGMSAVVAQSGSTLPQVSDGGSLSGTLHVVTTDGAGPYTGMFGL
jgi:hypothetical protein